MKEDLLLTNRVLAQISKTPDELAVFNDLKKFLKFTKE